MERRADMLEYIILGILMCGRTSGYDLKQWMTDSTSYFFDASFGSIYPALKRLAEKNMVTFSEVVEGGKYKKLYQITGIGKDAFMQWIAQPIVFERSRQDHLVKIFFYEFLPKEKAIANLKGLIVQIEPVARQLTEQKNEAARKFDIYRFYYRYAAMHYGIDSYNFMIKWCEELIDKLENDPETDRAERFKELV
jgi:Predicted transcriptional regulators